MIEHLVAAAVVIGAGQAETATARRDASAVRLAPGVDLLRGTFVPGTQPDGNTVLIEGPSGLIVIDTGRHQAHTQRILDYARAAELPIAAVINTHWHLDHDVGGNALIRRAFPQVRVHASSAIEEAMTGFLAQYRKYLEGALAKAAGDLEKERPLRCAPRWEESLDRLAKVPFTQLVPGHGPALGPAEFAAYRRAFSGLLACAASPRTKEACADGWLTGLGDLIPKDDHAFTRSLLDYYMDAHLRADPARAKAPCTLTD
ncbi:MAG TPA: MBL fold metallo-hydrolase [Vicinamibacteria bacterium]|nr:MBL fold metallo-hydrolase [Vicinamibacteria bacterium]